MDSLVHGMTGSTATMTAQRGTVIVRTAYPCGRTPRRP
jgi:hypothetical protein